MPGKQLQEHINEEVRADIGKLYDHAKVANEEMSVIKTDILWIKGVLEKVEGRTWLILATIIIGFLVQIGLKIIWK